MYNILGQLFERSEGLRQRNRRARTNGARTFGASHVRRHRHRDLSWWDRRFVPEPRRDNRWSSRQPHSVRMLNERRPCALTQGDPSGIGPEITLRAWLQRSQAGVPPFFVLTDPDFLRRSARQLGWHVPIEAIAPEHASQAFNRALPVVPLHAPVSATFGQPGPASAASTIESIETAVRLVTEGSAA